MLFLGWEAIFSNDIKEIKDKQDAILGKTPYSSFLFTHNIIKSNAKKEILITRNPLEQIISAYYYFYKNRGCNQNIESLWKSLADHYIKVHNEQGQILFIHKEDAIANIWKYEDLVIKPYITFKSILDFIEMPVDESLLLEVIENNSQKSFIELEKNIRKSKYNNHFHFGVPTFIRSGNIGDWKEHISVELAKEIINYIEYNGINIRSIYRDYLP